MKSNTQKKKAEKKPEIKEKKIVSKEENAVNKEENTLDKEKMLNKEAVSREEVLNKEPADKSQVLVIVALLLLLVVLVFLIFLLYKYIPGEPKELTASPLQIELKTTNLSYEFKQFYPNMKFNHNYISYQIEEYCEDEKKERMKNAFKQLADKVELISFYEVEETPDIEVSCSKESSHITKGDFFIAGEGGAKVVVPTGRYNVISSGAILLYDDAKGVKCDWPNIELHELLHVFGFEHSQDKNSLMNVYLESCLQELDESIIYDLKELYSAENLADLYFENVSAIKKGIYLDFNVTIKNSGVIDARDVTLSVFENDERVDNFDLKDISFGGGATFSVSNSKLRSRSSENIKIVIDPDESIREIDEANNIAKLEFVS